MTALELAKGVVERSAKANNVGPFKGQTNALVSPDEAEAIGRLVAWAECHRAYNDWYYDDCAYDQLLELLIPLGFVVENNPEKFVRGLLEELADRGLRNAVMGKAGE